MSDTLDTLYSEHRYLSTLLDILETESARLKPRKVPDYHLLLDIIDYLTHYPDVYHHPREDLLFTTMVDRDDEFEPLLERLEREHRTLKQYNHELFNELTAVVAGRAADRPLMLRSIERYIDAYRQHMDYESREIFPRAKGVLSAADQRKLARKTQAIDDPLFGGEIQYRYQRVGRNLQSRMELAGQDMLTNEFEAIQSSIGRLSRLADTLEDLKDTVTRRGSESWQEQKEMISEHLQRGQGPSVASLPLALIRHHGRHVKEGIAEIRQKLRSGQGDDAAGRER